MLKVIWLLYYIMTDIFVILNACFYQKSDPHLLQCHFFPTFLLASPNMPVEITLLAVVSLDVFVE
nr:MAG TPA: hypothetical protein [Caudoviricetes sp.]